MIEDVLSNLSDQELHEEEVVDTGLQDNKAPDVTAHHDVTSENMSAADTSPPTALPIPPPIPPHQDATTHEGDKTLPCHQKPQENHIADSEGHMAADDSVPVDSSPPMAGPVHTVPPNQVTTDCAGGKATADDILSGNPSPSLHVPGHPPPPHRATTAIAVDKITADKDDNPSLSEDKKATHKDSICTDR